MNSFSDADLPPFFTAADTASGNAQKATLMSSRLRLLGAIVAAFGGSFTFLIGKLDIWAAVALLGFLVALGSEVFITIARPERRWYQARAGAESVKTLSWRYAVGADPFFLSLPGDEAKTLFRNRVSQVAIQVAQAVSLPYWRRKLAICRDGHAADVRRSGTSIGLFEGQNASST